MGWSLIGSVNVKYTIINYQQIKFWNWEKKLNRDRGFLELNSKIGARNYSKSTFTTKFFKKYFVLLFPCYQQNNAYSRLRLDCVINCVGRQKVQKSGDWKFSGGYEVENWRLKVRGWTLLINIINLVLTALALTFPVLSL